MARYRGPKNKLARRFQANIFGRARNPLLHKANPPGLQGMRRRKKSDYGLQLEEKQKLKAVYGMISAKQLVKYYREAVRCPTNTAHALIELLETRLDVVVYRLTFAPTIFAAHQLISHGHIAVNGRRVDRRSFQVKPGMEISIIEKSRKQDQIKHALAMGRDIPDYLSLNAETFTGQLLSTPAQESIPFPILINHYTVCELLAHTT